MGVSGPFRWIDLRDTQRDLAGFDLLPKSIELFELVRVRAHKGCREVDVPLRDTLEAADRRERTAVTNGGDDTFIEHRTVRESVDASRKAFAKPRSDIIASSDHDIGAERCNQPFIFLGSVGDHRQPLGFGELYDVPAISARRPGHCDDLTRGQLQQIE